VRSPRFPIYIPSKDRADQAFTAEMLFRDGVDFKVVVEPQEVEKYSMLGKQRLLVLPENDRGLVYARNWIKDHATAAGHERHWQFDDDIPQMERVYRGYRIQCSSNAAIVVAEDFAERYENIALLSFNSTHFVLMSRGRSSTNPPPFYLNHRCYTCFK